MKRTFSLVPAAASALLLAASEPPAAETAGPPDREVARRESPLLDFQYGWPAAIASEPELRARLSADLAKSNEEALGYSRENKTDTEKYGGPFNQNFFDRQWTLEGETPQLLSLVENTDTFTGGAHPNHKSSALLWDRSAKQEVEFEQLFTAPGGLTTAIRSDYCQKLDAERQKRREGETLDGQFAQCPAFSELTIAPAHNGGPGPFNSILLIADPYVAGPYAEGDYTIEMPVTPALIAALKPAYRGSFEAQRPQ